MEELKIVVFCKRIPKVSNKFPDEELPTEGFILSHKTELNGIFRKANGNIFLTQIFDFVISKNGTLKIGNKHHFLGNREDVLFAGCMKFKNGKIAKLDNLSGHYRPSVEETERLVEIFDKLNIPIKRARIDISAFKVDSKGMVEDFRITKRIFIGNLK